MAAHQIRIQVGLDGGEPFADRRPAGPGVPDDRREAAAFDARLLEPEAL
jgi:hypothetical protein